MSEEYKEILETIYEENHYTKGKDIFVKALIYLETGCSFNEREYSIYISTGVTFMSPLDTELIDECIDNYLEGVIGKIPTEENILIEMVDDGEQEDMSFNRYFTIKKVYILTLEEIEENPVKEILGYLNDAKRKMTGNQSLTGYRETTAVKRIINARLKEKFTVEDFKRVIHFKAESWKGTTMAEYLRPSTLFSATHFSEYLCEAEASPKSSESKPDQEKDNKSGFDRLQEKYGR